MKFIKRIPPLFEDQVICRDPTSAKIRSIFQAMIWQEPAELAIEIDAENCLYVNWDKDGFTLTSVEDGYENGAVHPAWSVDELIYIFQLYARHDERWRQETEWEDDDLELPFYLKVLAIPYIIFKVVQGLVRAMGMRLSILFGKRYRAGGVVMVAEDDEEMKRAITEARAGMAQFFAVLDAPTAGDDSFALKVKITDDNGSEHLWLKDVKREEGRLEGTIDNTPTVVGCVEMGERITVDEAKITDWGYFHAGQGQGFYTVRALLKNLSKRERDGLNRQFGWG